MVRWQESILERQTKRHEVFLVIREEYGNLNLDRVVAFGVVIGVVLWWMMVFVEVLVKQWFHWMHFCQYLNLYFLFHDILHPDLSAKPKYL